MRRCTRWPPGPVEYGIEGSWRRRAKRASVTHHSWPACCGGRCGGCSFLPGPSMAGWCASVAGAARFCQAPRWQGRVVCFRYGGRSFLPGPSMAGWCASAAGAARFCQAPREQGRVVRWAPMWSRTPARAAPALLPVPVTACRPLCCTASSLLQRVSVQAACPALNAAHMPLGALETKPGTCWYFGYSWGTCGGKVG